VIGKAIWKVVRTCITLAAGARRERRSLVASARCVIFGVPDYLALGNTPFVRCALERLGRAS